MTRRHPVNPWLNFLFALFFVLAGAASVYIWIVLHERALAFNMVGRRSELFVLLGPIVFLALAVFATVRGIRALRPWAAYRSSVSPAQQLADRDLDMRGGHPAPFLVLGVLAAAGFLLFLAGFIGWGIRDFEDLRSTVFIFEFMMICLILAVAGIGIGALMIGARRRPRTPGALE